MPSHCWYAYIQLISSSCLQYLVSAYTLVWLCCGCSLSVLNMLLEMSMASFTFIIPYLCLSVTAENASELSHHLLGCLFST